MGWLLLQLLLLRSGSCESLHARHAGRTLLLRGHTGDSGEQAGIAPGRRRGRLGELLAGRHLRLCSLLIGAWCSRLLGA